MEPIELLSKQLEQYQNQNAREHEVLSAKIDNKYDAILNRIDELVSIYNALHSERLQDEAKILEIEDRQKKIQADVQDIKDHQMKRAHLWSWILKALGTISVIGGIIATSWKFGIF